MPTEIELCDTPCELKFFVLVRFTEEEIVQFYIRHRVLPYFRVCSACKSLLTINKNLEFRCGRWRGGVKCNLHKSAKAGTWLNQCRVSVLKMWLFVVIVLYIHHPRVYLLNHLELSSRTITDWTFSCREVMLYYFNKNSTPLGGKDRIVQVGEAKFIKTKFTSASPSRQEIGSWVFGAIDVSSGNFYLSLVHNRNSETLLPIIRRIIRPGSIIQSDEWEGYTPLSRDPNYTHRTINHSEAYVNSVTGFHANNIERLWRKARSKIPKCGTREDLFPYYIAEFYFSQRVPCFQLIHEFFNTVAEMYPVY